MNARFYDFLVPLVRLYYRLFYGIRASGTEHIPKTGGFVVSANHVHVRDPFVLAACCRGRRLHFMAKAELFRNKLVGWLVRSVGAFPVRRGEADLGAVRQSLRILADGHALGIFPQGTRGAEGERKQMEGGVALIALRAGTGVLPAYIDERYRLFGRARVIFGPMITFDDLGRRADRAALTEATERIERAIWALKPEQ